MEKYFKRPQYGNSHLLDSEPKNSRTRVIPIRIRAFIILAAFTSFVPPVVMSDFSSLFDAGHKGQIRCTSESREVNRCMNLYHELDFRSINTILYPPNVKFNLTCQPNVTMDDTQWKTIRLEEPTLKDNLDKIQDIYSCLSEELGKCDQLNAFFALRHLLFALQKILDWLNCRNTSEFRCSEDAGKFHRFIDILKAGQCLECYRHSPSLFVDRCNFKLDVTNSTYLWVKIIRLEVGPEVCPELEKLYKCFKDRNVADICGSTTHSELLSLFIKEWCRSHPQRSGVHHLTFNYLYLAMMIGLYYF